MKLLKYLTAILFLCGIIFSQISIKIDNIINLPVKITDNDFQPTNFCVSATGIYFLDKINRQAAFLSNDDEVILSGGYGVDNDAFIDPIDILNSQLRVWIIDRTENKLIEFDHKLNYLRTIQFDEIYPEFCGIDDWGNVYLQSNQEQKIVKANPFSDYEFTDFIDLSLWDGVGECNLDTHFAPDGSIGILSNCEDSMYIFSRLGQINKKYLLDKTSGDFIIKLAENWFTISVNGHISSIHGEKFRFPIISPIIDISQKDEKLYILTSKQVWVLDVAME